MNIGSLDHRIAFYQPTYPQDATTGEVTMAYALITTVWGSVADKSQSSGDEEMIAGKRQAKGPYEFVIRYGAVAGLDTTFQLEYNSERYDIVSIAEYFGLGRNRALKILAINKK